MIEFCGQLSDKVVHYMLKQEAISGVIISLIILMVVVIITIILGLMWDWIVLLCNIIPVLMIILTLFCYRKPTKKLRNLIMPNRVCILEDTIECENGHFYHIRFLSDIKKIIDFGEWYHIIFKYAERNQCFVCQKTLISKGTIEDFEKLFEGKINRKF